MSPEPIPVLWMFRRYPEQLKGMIKNPLKASVEALVTANERDDWAEVAKAVELLDFLATEYSLKRNV